VFPCVATTPQPHLAFPAQGFAEDSLKWWDVSFWAERLREAKYAINEEELRPYFALPQVRPPLSSWLANHHSGPTWFATHMCPAMCSCCCNICTGAHHCPLASRCCKGMDSAAGWARAPPEAVLA